MRETARDKKDERETERERKDERETVSDRADSERQTDIQTYRQCESE